MDLSMIRHLKIAVKKLCRLIVVMLSTSYTNVFLFGTILYYSLGFLGVGLTLLIYFGSIRANKKDLMEMAELQELLDEAKRD
jgi:hypothetical protein